MICAINGYFLTQKITGMQRFAREVLVEMDKICQQGEFEVVLPKGDYDCPKLENIAYVRYGKRRNIFWEQFSLPRYLKKNKRECFSMLSVAPVLNAGGPIVAHGVNYKVNPQFFKSFRDKLSRLWHVFNFHFYFKKSQLIFTVSDFSKSEIIRTYKVDPNRIVVVGNGWQHINRCEEDSDFLNKYPQLIDKSFFFSMSSVNDNKNFKWIALEAAKNPNVVFAIAGGRSLQSYLNRMGIEKPSNLLFLGYISDEEAKACYKHCKAFLFPTFYEGFGIPPMEALACGADIIVSDTPTMHEVYGDSAVYIDPFKSNYDLEDLLRGNSSRKKHALDVLKRYSWQKTAEMVYFALKEGA